MQTLCQVQARMLGKIDVGLLEPGMIHDEQDQDGQ